MATLTIIIEQTLDCNTGLSLAFIDHEKAFHSADEEVTWSILEHYGVSEKYCQHDPENIGKMIQKMLPQWF